MLGLDKNTLGEIQLKKQILTAALLSLLAGSLTAAELTVAATPVPHGDILRLVPLQRGPSGRICRLRIEGTRRTFTLGKELEIRRALSRSHLFSSAFVVDCDRSLPPARFTLLGAGWGHGVGLCQIGAAVMGERGYTYYAILHHYYPHTTIETRY